MFNEKDLFLHSVLSGPVVQLVRIHACHAWGRGFESRPDRSNYIRLLVHKQPLFFESCKYEHKKKPLQFEAAFLSVTFYTTIERLL